MSYNSNLKFKIRKWTKFGDLSIRPRTVRVRTTDHPPYQDLDSPSQQSRPSKVTGRGSSTDPSRTVCDRQINRAEAVRVSLSTLVSLSLTPHTPKGDSCRLWADGEANLRTDCPGDCWKFLNYVFISVFQNLMEFVWFIQLWEFLGFSLWSRIGQWNYKFDWWNC
jgi:hypothetical protein